MFSFEEVKVKKKAVKVLDEQRMQKSTFTSERDTGILTEANRVILNCFAFYKKRRRING